MSQAEVIDGLQFARDASRVRGTLGPAQLPRLAEMRWSVDEIAFDIQGGLSRQGKSCLRIQAVGHVELVCQRCLGPLALEVSVDVELELCESLSEIEQADDDVDRVLATRSMSVAQLVEDELILCLPIAPKHEDCAAASPVESGKRDSPFDVLAQWKKRSRP